MPRISDTKPNATGRSSGKLTGRHAKQLRPPKGEPFIWFTKSMLESPAWGSLTINARRVLDRLLLEHMNHAGSENGALICTYDDFMNYGVRRSSARPAIDLLTLLGFIRCKRGGRWNGTNTPSIYRLTWLGDKNGVAPTNEWEKVTEEQLQLLKRQKSDLLKAYRVPTKKQGSPRKSGTTVVPLPVLREIK